MRKIFVLIFVVLFFQISAYSQVLESGVMLNEIPDEFFGSWRVNGKLDKTNAYSRFKPQSIDFWNLSRKNDRVRLENPMSGADAEISINTVEGDLIIFTRKTTFDTNKILTDKVNIRLNGNSFSGINELKLEQYSLIDNHLMKTETAIYKISGEKLSGESILKN